MTPPLRGMIPKDWPHSLTTGSLARPGSAHQSGLLMSQDPYLGGPPGPWPSRLSPSLSWFPSRGHNAFPYCLHVSACLPGSGGGGLGVSSVHVSGSEIPQSSETVRQQPLAVTFSSIQRQEGLHPHSTETTYSFRSPGPSAPSQPPSRPAWPPRACPLMH